GASQLETWDPKPKTETGGPFRAIETSVPGVRISELLPMTARQMHRLALVRGLNTNENDHGKGHYLMHTGRPQAPRPHHPPPRPRSRPGSSPGGMRPPPPTPTPPRAAGGWAPPRPPPSGQSTPRSPSAPAPRPPTPPATAPSPTPPTGAATTSAATSMTASPV